MWILASEARYSVKTVWSVRKSFVQLCVKAVAGIKDAVVSTFAVSKIHSFPHNGHRLKKTDLSGSRLACVTALRDIEHM